MTDTPNKRFPQSLSVLCAVMDEHVAPPEIMRIIQSSKQAMLHPNPRTYINKSFCGLRTARNGIFAIAAHWLDSEEAETIFTEKGEHWARIKLIKAFRFIDSEETPHIALEMNKDGRPPVWGFTKIEDAAIYAQYLHVNEGYSIDNAKMAAENSLGVNKANINKAKIPDKLSPKELKEQAEVITIKYKL